MSSQMLYKVLVAGALLGAFSACSDTGGAGNVDPDLLEQLRAECLDVTNMYRATENKTALGRWEDAEDCSDSQAAADQSGAGAHGGFGACGEAAQNTCPGWPVDSTSASYLRVVRSCLQSMWKEGPGVPYAEHGHYLNMSSTTTTRLACGFSESGGKLWLNMNFK